MSAQRLAWGLAFGLVALISCLSGAVGVLLVIPAPTPYPTYTPTPPSDPSVAQLYAVATLNAANATRQAAFTPTPTPTPSPTPTCLESAKNYLQQTDGRLKLLIDEINRRTAAGTGVRAWSDFSAAGWQAAKREIDTHTPPPCLRESHQLVIAGLDDIILGIVAYINGKPYADQLSQGEQKFMQGYAARFVVTGAPTPRPNLLNLPKR